MAIVDALDEQPSSSPSHVSSPRISTAILPSLPINTNVPPISASIGPIANLSSTTKTHPLAPVPTAFTSSQITTAPGSLSLTESSTSLFSQTVASESTTLSSEVSSERMSRSRRPSPVTTATTRETTSRKKKRPKTITTPYLGPTSYGNGTVETKCQPPPSTFAGTDAGFKSLCRVRYCPVPAQGNMIWESNDGEVTRTEIESALGMLANVPPVWITGIGNILSDGPLGQGAYNAGLLYEVTGDIRALDLVVRMADNILALQNDPEHGQILWTGKREPIWPTSPFYPNNNSVLLGAGCEQGDIVGHMVNAAVYILKSPCLWDMQPPAYDGPTFFQSNETYLQRALTFIEHGDLALERYLIMYFLDPARDWALIQPNDRRWSLVGDIGNKPGEPMPWNRRMIMLHGFLRLAAAHELYPVQDLQRVAFYDHVVSLNVKAFLASLNATTSAQGRPTFDWDYVEFEDHIEESMGVHGYFDIMGIWQAWQRNPSFFGVTNEVGTRFGNTFQDTINLGNNSFSGLVNGESNEKSPSVPGLWAGWSFYSLWVPEWFDTLVNANLAAKNGFNGRSWLAVPLCQFSARIQRRKRTI
ncbi:hypothetical protein OIV83_004397 [Microbotryomycetes sp. JL201]|nr:hypothetical protein OIV83_004397 [Microbotryomycetes sp. JL201]